MKANFVIVTLFILAFVTIPLIYWVWLTTGRWIALNYDEYIKRQKAANERADAEAAAAAAAAAVATAA